MELKVKLVEFFGLIINEEYDEAQQQWYLREGSLFIDKCLNLNLDEDNDEKRKALFYFLDDLPDNIPEILKIISTTISLIKELNPKKSRKILDLDTIKEDWSKELLKSGINHKKAERIVKLFIKDIQILIQEKI